jgi:hypothetical protein
MNGEDTRETPLAWSQSGDAFEVPEAAELWRVRRLIGNSKGGAPELVYGVDGLPLMVDVTIGPSEFIEVVDGKVGKYRLDALDELRKPVPGVPPAYFVVSATSGTRAERHESATADVALRTLADAFKQQSDQIGTAFRQQADQINGLITQVRDFAQQLALRPVAPEPPVLTLPAPRNGLELTPADGGEDDEDFDDDDDDQDEQSPPREPDWFDRVQEFCTQVPPESLRVVGQMVGEVGPKVVADAVGKVLTDGLSVLGGGGSNQGGGS